MFTLTFPIISAKYGSEFSDLITEKISPIICGDVSEWTPFANTQSRKIFTSLN